MANHVRSVFPIRRGRTSYNAAHKLQSQVDIPLNTVDEWQVKQTATALEGLYVDHRQKVNRQFIVYSDLERAHTATQAFADILDGIKPIDDRRARERSFGDWDGHAVAELAERYPGGFRSWMEPWGGELKYGVEPKEAVGKCGVEALEDWSTRAGGDTGLFVFSHDVWIAQTLRTLLGIFAIDPTFSTVALLHNAHQVCLVPIDNPDDTVRWHLLDYNHGSAIASTDEWERER